MLRLLEPRVERPIQEVSRSSVHPGHRGVLASLEFGTLPFVPLRLFSVSQVRGDNPRGGHGHRQTIQLLLCEAGSILVRWDDCVETSGSMLLTPQGPGLLIQPLVWATQTNTAPDSLLVVLASHAYDAEDYLTADEIRKLRLSADPVR